MNVEEILIEADKLGIRKKVLERVTELRTNSPYRRDLKSYSDYIEQAYEEIIKNIPQ